MPRPADAPLESIYVQNLRQRFKSEVNRLTSGAMQTLLHGQADADKLSFLFSYLYAWHWLRSQVDERYHGALLAAFKGSSRAFLMDLLEMSPTPEAFVSGYIYHWTSIQGQLPRQGRDLLELIQLHDGDQRQLLRHIMGIWNGLKLFELSDRDHYRQLARRERTRYQDMLSAADQERLALIDALPEPDSEVMTFDKLGLIPAMGCPQTCRHCMFIWRPPMKGTDQAYRLYPLVDQHTRSVLFTGGDLSRHLHHFYAAIEQMRHVTTFAILLNGDFADTQDATRQVLDSMSRAVRRRPVHWPKAEVVLQISFDEFHQEVIVDKKGRLRERIPVKKIANIVELAPRYDEIRLALLHKQNHLNFSMQLFEKGVFGRLVAELGRRGQRVQVISAAPAARHKVNPVNPEQRGAVLKDASFVLQRYPERPILLTSSTIDAFGRAEIIEAGEAVQERAYLQQVLSRSLSPGEGFDTDLMFWFNGWATLFSAVHMCLGNVYSDGAERIFSRLRKDPLTHALANFDTKLLGYYQEQREDLPQCIERASSPHQLFHRLTEDAPMRLHMTRRLLQKGDK